MGERSFSLNTTAVSLENIANAVKSDNLNMAQVLRDIDSDMNGLEGHISDHAKTIDHLRSKVNKLEVALTKTLAALGEMGWALKKSCDKCKGAELLVLRAQDLQRSIYLEDTPQGETNE